MSGIKTKYRFFKEGNEWRYIEEGKEQSDWINTSALECTLLVLGGPEVVVVREQPNGETYHITIKDGVIDKVESVVVTFIGEEITPKGDKATYTQVSRIERTEFFIEE